MEYINKELDCFKLHMIKTNNFKTIIFKIVIKDKIKKEDITKRNLLALIMNAATNKYPTRRDIALELENLYAASIGTNPTRKGKTSVINLTMSILSEKYTEPGMVEKSIEFLNEIFFHPFVKDNKFDEDVLNQIKLVAKTSIESLKEDPDNYSVLRALAAIDDKEYSYSDYGYLEDIETTTQESLYAYYQKLLSESKVDIYVLGDFDTKEMETLLTKHLPFSANKNKKIDEVIIHEQKNNEVKSVIEEIELGQSKLLMMSKIYDITDYEKNYVLAILNAILGASPDSKLFKNVREKHSIAYSCFSFYNKLDNLLIIKSGIDKKNYEKAVELIKKETNDIKEGNFTDEDIINSKNIYKREMIELVDSPMSLINAYSSGLIGEFETIESNIDKINQVTKEEIINVSKKILLDTIYLLKGTYENEGV